MRKDLKKLNGNHFESLWIECNLTNDNSNKKKLFINVNYNPHKSLSFDFFEEFSDSIELAIVENKTITLKNYNIDYLKEREQKCLDTVTQPHGLRILNTNIPTRVKDSSKTLIDYIKTDLNNFENFTNIISDTPLRTLKNKPVDRFGTTTITYIRIKRHTKVTIKELFN